jgi:hypothetical protein
MGDREIVVQIPVEARDIYGTHVGRLRGNMTSLDTGGFSTERRGQLKYDGTRAETIFRLSAKRTNPFNSAGGGEASVQSTTGSRGVRISGTNGGYTMFRVSVKSTGHPLHSLVSPSLPLPCVTVCHYISTAVCYDRDAKLTTLTHTYEFKNKWISTSIFFSWRGQNVTFNFLFGILQPKTAYSLPPATLRHWNFHTFFGYVPRSRLSFVYIVFLCLVWWALWMILETRVTDIPLTHFKCHGQWDEEGGGTKWRPPYRKLFKYCH